MNNPMVWAVEDNPDMQKTLRVIFSRLGCVVTVYGTAEEALAGLGAGGRPDVMILDFRLPGMSGPQLFRRMGLDERWRGIPVIPFTSQGGHGTPSPMTQEWERLASALGQGDSLEAGVVQKLEGDDFTIPERLILSVGNVLKSSSAGLPKPFEDAVLDLVNRVMKYIKEAGPR